jgi:hypothetical protein
MHTVVRDSAPEYVSDMVTPVSALCGCAHLRSAALGTYDVSRTKTPMGAKTFSVAGPKAWNSLPQSIRVIRSTATVNRHLKIYLLEIAFNLQSLFIVSFYYVSVFYYMYFYCEVPLAELYCKRRHISSQIIIPIIIIIIIIIITFYQL